MHVLSTLRNNYLGYNFKRLTENFFPTHVVAQT